MIHAIQEADGNAPVRQRHTGPGVVTSVLVNRNNAATLFGLTALATLGLFFWKLPRTDRHLVLRDIRSPSPPA